MIQLRVRTEYSFRRAFGRVPEVVAALRTDAAAAITDRGATWGHVNWMKACKKAGIRPLFGVEHNVVADAT